MSAHTSEHSFCCWLLDDGGCLAKWGRVARLDYDGGAVNKKEILKLKNALFSGFIVCFMNLYLNNAT